MKEKIQKAQALLQKEGLDGWLLYDFQKRNPLAIAFLEIPPALHLTRRLFYWIPAKGEPIKIVHLTETHVLDPLIGQTLSYYEGTKLEEHLKKILAGKRKIAMEYSPKNAIPAISFVDGGTLDMVRELGVQVVSSGSFIQAFTCVLTAKQREQHLQAAEILDHIAALTWEQITSHIKEKKQITEYDVQEFMVKKMEEAGCLFAGRPICAVNANSSNPHYGPTKEQHTVIQEGDFIQLDLWCKKNEEGAVYADISRVGVVSKEPTEKQKEIFRLVRLAQQKATKWVEDQCKAKKAIHGCDVDRVARSVLEEAGYGAYFIHRTGHNIYTDDHGPGAHLDSIETVDDRELILETCFSIEPGIYLPGEFGLRLEYDVYITKDQNIEISGGVQEAILTLLSS